MTNSFLKAGERQQEVPGVSSLPGPGLQPAGDGNLPVFVIIPVYGNGFYLARCLESLRAVEGLRLKVLLVDDGSPEAVADHLTWPEVRCHRLEENHGPAYAVNRGIEETASDWVLVLNSDVQVPPASLNHLLETLAERPGYDFAVAKLLLPKDPPTLDSVGDGLLIGGGGYRIGHDEVERGQYSLVRPVLSAAGTASIYRRSLLEELGGFDEDFFGFLEDLDLSLRAHLRGYQGLYVPTAVVYHQGGVTFKCRGDKEIFRLITRNQIWVMVKNYPATVLLRALPRILVFQPLWLALMTSRGLLGSYLRGLGEALLGLPRMLRKRRHIQRSRKITPPQFWQLLKNSEREIAAWQRRLPPAERSLLLRIYFGLFGWPPPDQKEKASRPAIA